MLSRRRAPEPVTAAEPVAPPYSPELAVARGAALLSVSKEHWRKRLAGLTLRVASVRECPLGRLYGSYGAGCEALGLDRAGAVAHGFVWPPGSLDDDELRAALDEAWAAQAAEGEA